MTEAFATTPREGVTLLGEQDEPAFVALLRAVYGDTYSYRELYEPGGVAAVIRSGRAALFGDLGPNGELYSHTAFLLKDVRGDYVESGMSFRGPRARLGTSDAVIWRHLFAWLKTRTTLVHQNTSTWHALAQRYAERHMRARPTGIIVDYVVGERLVGMQQPETPMQALTMTTIVRPEAMPAPSLPRLVPRGLWGEWISGILRSMGVAEIAYVDDGPTPALALEAFEHNASIGLSRRVVGAAGASLSEAIHVAAARTDLVHLPCDARMAVFPVLIDAGFVPVGVRVHASRPDEVVLQRLPERGAAIDAVARASLIPAAKGLVSDWRAACARTS